MSASEVARQHQADRRQTIDAAGQVAAQAWTTVDPANIVASWTMALPQLTVTVSGAQLAAALTADDYLDELGGELDFDPATDLEVDPRGFAGTASDGRGLASLLASPAFTALQAIGTGMGVLQALSLGGQHLDTIVRTQVADAGRVADGVALTARRDVGGYVRQVVGATCSRCVILAGRWYRWSSGFQRHPHCDCVHLPCPRSEAKGLLANPKPIYDSMSVAQRQRAGWSLADQRAIAEGADITDVTNVHGVTSAGTKRSIGRLTPEQIYRRAAGDRDEAIRLLQQNGYLRGQAVPR